MSLGFEVGTQRIKSCVTDNWRNILLTPDGSNEKQYYKEIEMLSHGRKIAIRYPGCKTTREKCDYCVLLVDKAVENAVSHREIMRDLEWILRFLRF